MLVNAGMLILTKLVQCYMFDLLLWIALNYKCKFYIKQSLISNVIFRQPGKRKFRQTLPKLQINASQHHPNLCDNICAMFYCDTSTKEIVKPCSKQSAAVVFHTVLPCQKVKWINCPKFCWQIISARKFTRESFKTCQTHNFFSRRSSFKVQQLRQFFKLVLV